MKNKLYEAPAIKKVRLVVKNAVLAVCRTSSSATPANDPGPDCKINPGCFS
jgi:hypothetical protein